MAIRNSSPLKRVLLTGGAGFVGANLARRLLGEGHEVHLLVRLESDLWRLRDIGEQLRWHAGSLEDDRRVTEIVQHVRPEWVFHLAAYGAYSSQRDSSRMWRVNVLGTVCLVEACLRAGCETLIHAGSSSEYGFRSSPASEADAPLPNSDYAVTKAAATLYCGYAARRHRARMATLRLYSVYGPWEEPTRFIPTLILRGLEGGLPPLVHPDIARDFVHIDDVVDAFCLAAAHESLPPGAIYNVGRENSVSLREAVGTAREILRLPCEPVWGSMPDRDWDTDCWVADCSRIRRDLGWSSPRPFDVGFRETVEWFRRNPAIVEHYRTHRKEP